MSVTRGGRRRRRARKTRFGRTAKAVKGLATRTLNIVPPVGRFTRGFLGDVGVKMGGKRRRRTHRRRSRKC